MVGGRGWLRRACRDGGLDHLEAAGSMSLRRLRLVRRWAERSSGKDNPGIDVGRWFSAIMVDGGGRGRASDTPSQDAGRSLVSWRRLRDGTDWKSAPTKATAIAEATASRGSERASPLEGVSYRVVGWSRSDSAVREEAGFQRLARVAVMWATAKLMPWRLRSRDTLGISRG